MEGTFTRQFQLNKSADGKHFHEAPAIREIDHGFVELAPQM